MLASYNTTCVYTLYWWGQHIESTYNNLKNKLTDAQLSAGCDEFALASGMEYIEPLALHKVKELNDKVHQIYYQTHTCYMKGMHTKHELKQELETCMMNGNHCLSADDMAIMYAYALYPLPTP
jgi:protoheme ferro-lyase